MPLAATDLNSRLAGKSLLVAGGGGIGSGLARRFAAEGANVVLGDISLEAAEAVASPPKLRPKWLPPNPEPPRLLR